MNSFCLLVIACIIFYAAYATYGKFIATRIFKVDMKAVCPSEQLKDDVDFVPTNKFILFGHHFTSIAGLGPIVGPAIGVIWGWVPAFMWILFGSIFMGAIHDFGSLVISLRHEGKSIGDVSAGIINRRVRLLFLLLIFFTVLIVIAIFALIIALMFKMYPEAIIPVFTQIPIAIILGHCIYRRKMDPLVGGILAVIAMYITIVIGAYVPVILPAVAGIDPLIIWIVILLIYAYIASTLPVQFLLQPRDYINSYQLIIAMILLFVGIMIAHPSMEAPAIAWDPQGAPPMIPSIFVVIACGAISGFHSLVSSGTSSKQCDNEKNALFVSYGSMLTEGILAILVILAIAAGLGMGLTTEAGTRLYGLNAFSHQYVDWNAANGLSAKLGAFVTGATNIIRVLGIPAFIIKAILGVFLVSFAATTLDSATRIQRYVVTEIALSCKWRKLSHKHVATLIAVISAFVLAFCNGSGKGALILWPLFGTVNQLLAGLSLFVITIYLHAKKINYWYALIPMVFMLFITGWAMLYNLQKFYAQGDWLLASIGIIISVLELWMVVEGILIFARASRLRS